MEAVVTWPTPALPRARDEKPFDRASVEYAENMLLPVVSIVSKRATDKVVWILKSSAS